MIERKEMECLYNTGEEYIFMDTASYEQISLGRQQMEDNIKYIKENLRLQVLFTKKVIGVELPHFVELKVAETIRV